MYKIECGVFRSQGNRERIIIISIYALSVLLQPYGQSDASKIQYLHTVEYFNAVTVRFVISVKRLISDRLMYGGKKKIRIQQTEESACTLHASYYNRFVIDFFIFFFFPISLLHPVELQYIGDGCTLRAITADYSFRGIPECIGCCQSNIFYSYYRR